MSFIILQQSQYCPLCQQDRQLCKITWMHHWLRCCYCLIKLPISKKLAPTFGEKQ